MAGIRISATAVLVTCSPPVGAYGGSGRPSGTDPQVWRSCSNNVPGDLTPYTDFTGFVDVDQVSNPVLSPDQFLYVAPTGGTLNNGVIMLDSVSSPGSPTTLRTPTAGWSCFRPHFNYDGTRIAYIMDQIVGAGGDLRVMDDDGSNDALLDSPVIIRLNQPTQHSWAWGSNQIVYEDGSLGGNAYVIQDDGSGKTQVNANGPAAGGSARVSQFAWAPDDSFVVFTENLGNGFFDVLRGELDGSTTTRLNTSHGPINQTWFQAAIVFHNRIWFIEAANSVSQGWLSSFLMDGTDYVNNFDSTDGPGDLIEPFTGGDGFYFN